MKLHYAKMSPYAQKVMIAFREKNVEFTPVIVQFMDPESYGKFKKLYPIGKVPMLELNDGTLIPESTSIVEYLDEKYTTGTKLIPTDKELARKVRHWDRMFDLYLGNAVSTLFFDGLKPKDKQNSEEVATCKVQIEYMYQLMDKELAKSKFAVGDAFTMADCTAYAPLFYAKDLAPFAGYKNVVSYFGRLMERASVRETLNEVLPELMKFQASMK